MNVTHQGLSPNLSPNVIRYWCAALESKFVSVSRTLIFHACYDLYWLLKISRLVLELEVISKERHVYINTYCFFTAYEKEIESKEYLILIIMELVNI